MRKFVIAIAAVGLVLASFTPAWADLLEDKTRELQELRKKIEQQQKELDSARKKTASLKNQIDILDKQITVAELQLQAITTDIDRTNASMTQINHDLVDGEVDIFEKKRILRDAMKEAYLRRQSGLLEAVLGSSDLSELISQIEYITAVEGRITGSLTSLKDLNEKLKAKKGELEAADRQLKQLFASKQLEQSSLEVQNQSKQNLLSDAQLTEAEYQNRLKASVAEQQRVQGEIAAIAKNSRRNELNVGNYSLFWPVPSRQISAGFQDADYVKRFGIGHNAIDIPTPQGTPIKAPASGYIAKVKDAGMGYSYITMDHGNGMVTVYGHVSAIMVSAGQFVPSGGVIGLTGGAPGSPGAGWLTTGSHLHFEVWLEGKPKNPLSYLIG